MKKIILILAGLFLPWMLCAQSNWKAIVRYDKQTAKTDLSNRLQKYAQIDSHAQPNTSAVPSSKQQLSFAKSLVKELKHIGAANVQVSKTGIVTADIPATQNATVPVLALIAHLDAPAQAQAQTLQNHAKNTSDFIVLDKEKNINLDMLNSPQLLQTRGHDLLTSNGTAAFGVESKAGLAILMTAADYLLGNTTIPHGLIKIVLLPDSFSHAGAQALDIAKLGADYALVLDGAGKGSIAAENFSGRSFSVVFNGRRDIARGEAIRSSFTDNLMMASDFHTLLPRYARPETTSGMQGYIWVDNIVTQDNRSTITGKIRAFKDADLEQLSKQVQQIFNTVKSMYPRNTGAEITFTDEFKNVQANIPTAWTQTIKNALEQEDIPAQYTAVRDQTDFAVLTTRGLPAISLFTGAFHGGNSLEYADVDIMAASLRGVMAILTANPAVFATTK